MSVRLFSEDVLFGQRLLACGGFDPGRLDGRYGDKTRAAEARAQVSYDGIKAELGAFDGRSEKAIATLLPPMQRKARLILKVALSLNIPDVRCSILSGTRTYAEQNRLYKIRPRVTRAGPGQSNHNFGIAVDVGVFIGAKYLTGRTKAEDKAYADLAALVKAQVQGVEWGGDWVSFKDAPHYQLKVNMTLAQVRKNFEKGIPFTS